MKLMDFRGEDAIDVLAEIIEPVTEIFSDKAIADAYRNHAKIATLAKLALKNHKHAVVEILAVCEGKTYDEYVDTITVLTLPLKALELFNDKELVDFFQQQSETMMDESSGSATENITAGA